MSKEELEDLRKAHEEAEAEMKSEEREIYLEHMKSIGQSFEELDLSHRVL